MSTKIKVGVYQCVVCETRFGKKRGAPARKLYDDTKGRTLYACAGKCLREAHMRLAAAIVQNAAP